jgi:hypothetical protein
MMSKLRSNKNLGQFKSQRGITFHLMREPKKSLGRDGIGHLMLLTEKQAHTAVIKKDLLSRSQHGTLTERCVSGD